MSLLQQNDAISFVERETFSGLRLCFKTVVGCRSCDSRVMAWWIHGKLTLVNDDLVKLSDGILFVYVLTEPLESSSPSPHIWGGRLRLFFYHVTCMVGNTSVWTTDPKWVWLLPIFMGTWEEVRFKHFLTEVWFSAGKWYLEFGGCL